LTLRGTRPESRTSHCVTLTIRDCVTTCTGWLSQSSSHSLLHSSSINDCFNGFGLLRCQTLATGALRCLCPRCGAPTETITWLSDAEVRRTACQKLLVQRPGAVVSADPLAKLGLDLTGASHGTAKAVIPVVPALIGPTTPAVDASWSISICVE
jgi:hypothetical protein